MDLSIIIVNYNSKEKARVCLRSISNSALEGISHEIFLIDNASTEPIDDLLQEFTTVRLIKSDVNLGMGGGNNLGLRQASGEFVLILNPDTELEKNTIKLLLNYIKDNAQVGLVGPKIVYPDSERQISCYRYPSLFMPLFRRTFLGRFNKGYLDYYLMKNFDLDQSHQVDWLMGSCFLIRKSVLDQVGLFDERFFLYFEDTDLCRRINQKGFKVVYFPFTQIIHHHGRASAKNHWFFAIFNNKLARIHLQSWLKYFYKWKFH